MNTSQESDNNSMVKREENNCRTYASNTERLDTVKVVKRAKKHGPFHRQLMASATDNESRYFPKRKTPEALLQHAAGKSAISSV